MLSGPKIFQIFFPSVSWMFGRNLGEARFGNPTKHLGRVQQAYVTYVFVLFKLQTVQAHDSSIWQFRMKDRRMIEWRSTRLRLWSCKTCSLLTLLDQKSKFFRASLWPSTRCNFTSGQHGDMSQFLMHLHLKFGSMQVNRLLWQCLPFYVQGQKVAFVGESGSGKSTIMALLERFYDPIAGAVLVNNQDLRTNESKNNEIAFDILIGSDSNNDFIVTKGTTNLPCKTQRRIFCSRLHSTSQHVTWKESEYPVLQTTLVFFAFCCGFSLYLMSAPNDSSLLDSGTVVNSLPGLFIHCF